MSQEHTPVKQDTMIDTSQQTRPAAPVDPVATSEMLANAAAQANHAATHAAIHSMSVEASRQAADCTNYATAAMHVAYDLFFATSSQGGVLDTPLRSLEYACMAADSARSATGFAARAVMGTVPPDQRDTALEQLPGKGTEAGAAHHPPARVPINWDTLSPYEKNAAVLKFFFSWPYNIPPESGSLSVPDYIGDWAKAMAVRDVFACASEERRIAFLQELIQATYEGKREQPLSVFFDCTPEDVCVAGLRTIGHPVLRVKEQQVSMEEKNDRFL